MAHHDGYGILGTPLHSDAKSDVKVSAQNKIAPTAAAYPKLRQRAVIRNDRMLMDKASLVATRADSLYIQRRPSSYLEDIMDDEDRTHLRVRGMISKEKADMEGHVSRHGTASSFLAKSVDIPEIVPKQARTLLGYQELQKSYSRQPEDSSQLQTRTEIHSDYRAFSWFAHSSHHDSKSGLGYWDKARTGGENIELGSKEDADTIGSREAMERKSKTDAAYRSDEEDYIGQLANAGYKNLDAATKIVSRKLKEGRTQLKRITGDKRRTLGDTRAPDCKSVRFSSFVQWGSFDKQDKQWTEYILPAHFVADPTHVCQKDRLKKNIIVLPPLLQQEYGALLRVYEQNRSKEADNVKTAISTAIEEQNAKLHIIRGLVLEDMGTRFMTPQAPPRKQKSSITLHSRRELDSHEPGYSSRHPQHGETNRICQHWKPENLLCKRLGVVQKPTSVSSVQEVKAPLKSKVLSSHQAEEFQIHSITTADGRRVDASSDDTILQDCVVVPHVNDDVDSGMNDDRSRRPSQQLVQTIFANGRLEDRGKITSGVTASNDANIQIVSRPQSEPRGVHKTRAVDFF